MICNNDLTYVNDVKSETNLLLCIKKVEGHRTLSVVNSVFNWTVIASTSIAAWIVNLTGHERLDRRRHTCRHKWVSIRNYPWKFDRIIIRSSRPDISSRIVETQ